MEEYFKLLPSDTCAELEFSAETGEYISSSDAYKSKQRKKQQLD